MKIISQIYFYGFKPKYVNIYKDQNFSLNSFIENEMKLLGDPNENKHV